MTINDDTPADLSSQRIDGLGGLSVQFKDGRSRLSRLYQEGAAKIRMPQVANDPMEAILINISGGLTGGDRLRWDVALERTPPLSSPHRPASASIARAAARRASPHA
ncbi:hypothetical protein HED49_03615 [Ochrobactrum daejeonense]|nr:hypothetical protein [Brucella daejeonensis]